MSPKLFFLIFFALLTISYQLKCSNYNDETCGGHNTNYNLKCIKLNSADECSEFEYDEGCTMTAQRACQKTETSGSYQCVLIEGFTPKCKRIDVDQYCQFDESQEKCVPRSGATIETGKMCKPSNNGKECSLQQKVCSDNIDNCNQYGDNCIKIKITSDYISYSQCQIVSVDSKCQINNNGECTDKTSNGPEAYEKCAFNSLYNECKPINLECDQIQDTEKCSTCKTSPSGSKCTKIDNRGTIQCKNIEINDSCEINENGKCVIKTESDTNICHFNTSYDGCDLFTVDQKCVLGESGDDLKCTDGTGLTDKDKNKCDFVVKGNTNQRCEPRAKTCYHDYDNDADTCNAEENCAYILSFRCYAIENDDKCEKKSNGECSAKEGITLTDYEKCDFIWKDDYTYKCQITNKNCYEYTSEELCKNAPEVDGKKCHYDKSSKCRLFFSDGNCILDSQEKCVQNGSGKLSQNEICYLFKGDYSINCYKRQKLCTDITSSNCDNYSPEAKLCFNLNGNGKICYEVKVDSQCTMNEKNECTGEDCQFDEDKKRCYYQESHGSLLRMRQFIFFMLFFMY